MSISSVCSGSAGPQQVCHYNCGDQFSAPSDLPGRPTHLTSPAHAVIILSQVVTPQSFRVHENLTRLLGSGTCTCPRSQGLLSTVKSQLKRALGKESARLGFLLPFIRLGQVHHLSEPPGPLLLNADNDTCFSGLIRTEPDNKHSAWSIVPPPCMCFSLHHHACHPPPITDNCLPSSLERRVKQGSGTRDRGGLGTFQTRECCMRRTASCMPQVSGIRYQVCISD